LLGEKEENGELPVVFEEPDVDADPNKDVTESPKPLKLSVRPFPLDVVVPELKGFKFVVPEVKGLMLIYIYYQRKAKKYFHRYLLLFIKL
jgi:hypothetical protein